MQSAVASMGMDGRADGLHADVAEALHVEAIGVKAPNPSSTTALTALHSLLHT